MDRRELRSELAFYVNFTEGAADQDFATARLNKALASAYKKIVGRAKTMTNRDHWVMNQEVTWPASAVRFTVPDALTQKGVIDIVDVTGSEPGFRFVIGSGGDAFWYDRKTLQWVSGSTGPGSARTLRFFYEAAAEDWKTDEESPQLIPPELHMLLVWEAACDLRNVGDDRVPADWRYERDELRLDFYKWAARGRPFNNVTTIGSAGETGGASTVNVEGFGSAGDGLSPP